MWASTSSPVSGSARLPPTILAPPFLGSGKGKQERIGRPILAPHHCAGTDSDNRRPGEAGAARRQRSKPGTARCPSHGIAPALLVRPHDRVSSGYPTRRGFPRVAQAPKRSPCAYLAKPNAGAPLHSPPSETPFEFSFFLGFER